MSRDVLVDTSAWIDALRRDGDSVVREAVRAATAQGRVVLCDMVRLELWNGARGEKEQRLLQDLERELVCVSMPSEVWQEAMELAKTCRTKGITVPATDLLIAACANHHGLDLLHHDGHFDQLGSIA